MGMTENVEGDEGTRRHEEQGYGYDREHREEMRGQWGQRRGVWTGWATGGSTGRDTGDAVLPSHTLSPCQRVPVPSRPPRPSCASCHRIPVTARPCPQLCPVLARPCPQLCPVPARPCPRTSHPQPCPVGPCPHVCVVCVPPVSPCAPHQRVPHTSPPCPQLEESLALKPRAAPDLANSSGPSPAHKVQRSVSANPKRRVSDQGEPPPPTPGSIGGRGGATVAGEPRRLGPWGTRGDLVAWVPGWGPRWGIWVPGWRLDAWVYGWGSKVSPQTPGSLGGGTHA